MTASADRVTAKPAPAATGNTTARPATFASAATTTAPASGSTATRSPVASPREALSAMRVPPIQARNVPRIHHIGRYHHVVPPPTASQVQGYALTGRSSTMSITENTTVPHNPIAAAPAMPSALRAVHASLMLPWRPRAVPAVPRQQDGEPCSERGAQGQRPRTHIEPRGGPREQSECGECRADCERETGPHSEDQRQRAIAAAPVF